MILYYLMHVQTINSSCSQNKNGASDFYFSSIFQFRTQIRFVRKYYLNFIIDFSVEWWDRCWPWEWRREASSAKNVFYLLTMYCGSKNSMVCMIVSVCVRLTGVDVNLPDFLYRPSQQFAFGLIINRSVAQIDDFRLCFLLLLLCRTKVIPI